MKPLLTTVVVIVVVLVGLYLFGLTQHRSIESSIDIDAPPQVVWHVLTDFESWGAWNPGITRMEGKAVVGTHLKASTNPDGPTGSWKGSPEVLVVKPNEEFVWGERRGPPGFMEGRHFFRLTPTETGTRLIHGGDATGFVSLLLSLDKFVPTQSQLHEGLDQMNRALKKRAEALARAASPRAVEPKPES